MRKYFVIVASVCFLTACSNDGNKLIGTWISESGDTVMTISSGSLWLDYKISVTGSDGYLNSACKTLVLYSNNGFNCYGFPDQTARIMYQSNLQPESDLLVATSVIDGNFVNYHRFH